MDESKKIISVFCPLGWKYADVYMIGISDQLRENKVDLMPLNDRKYAIYIHEPMLNHEIVDMLGCKYLRYAYNYVNLSIHTNKCKLSEMLGSKFGATFRDEIYPTTFRYTGCPIEDVKDGTWIVKNVMRKNGTIGTNNICPAADVYRTIDKVLEVIDAPVGEAVGERDSEYWNTHQIAVQKYIEDPMLVDGKKFSITVYVLVLGKTGVFVYNKPSVRMSDVVYNPENNESQATDVINLAKHGKNFEKDLELVGIPLSKITDFVSSFASIFKPARKQKKQFFHVFDVDILVDASGKLWLGEIDVMEWQQAEKYPCLWSTQYNMVKNVANIVFLRDLGITPTGPDDFVEVCNFCEIDV